MVSEAISPLAAARLLVLAMAAAAPASEAAAAPADLVAALAPDLVADGAKEMAAFDAPGVALGIVGGDRLVYAEGGAAVGTATAFQIGSTTTAFLATSMARTGEFALDDRAVDRHPEFHKKDAWVTGEFRGFDLLARRSGVPPMRTTRSVCSAPSRPR